MRLAFGSGGLWSGGRRGLEPLPGRIYAPVCSRFIPKMYWNLIEAHLRCDAHHVGLQSFARTLNRLNLHHCLPALSQSVRLLSVGGIYLWVRCMKCRQMLVSVQ